MKKLNFANIRTRVSSSLKIVEPGLNWVNVHRVQDKALAYGLRPRLVPTLLYTC